MEISCKKCGLVNDFNTKYLKSNNSIQAYCNGCERFIKNIPHSKNETLYFGKYKGLKLSEITDKPYLLWVERNIISISEGLKQNILNRISEL